MKLDPDVDSRTRTDRRSAGLRRVHAGLARISRHTTCACPSAPGKATAVPMTRTATSPASQSQEHTLTEFELDVPARCGRRCSRRQLDERWARRQLHTTEIALPTTERRIGDLVPCAVRFLTQAACTVSDQNTLSLGSRTAMTKGRWDCNRHGYRAPSSLGSLRNQAAILALA